MVWMLIGCAGGDGDRDRDHGASLDPFADPPSDPVAPEPSPPAACDRYANTLRIEGEDPLARYDLLGGPSLTDDGRVSVVLRRLDWRGEPVDQAVVRVFAEDGARDPTFAADGRLPADGATRVSWQSDGGFWLARGRRIERRDPDGGLDPAFGVAGVSADVDDAVLYGVDSDGNPLLVDGSDLLRLGADGWPTGIASLDGGFSGVVGLPNGRIAVGLGGVRVLDADGQEVPLATEIPWPQALAGTPDGVLWAVGLDGSVQRYDDAGAWIDTVALSAPEGWSVMALSARAAPDGSVWVGGAVLEDGGSGAAASAWHLGGDGAVDPCAPERGRYPLDGGPYGAFWAGPVTPDGAAVFGDLDVASVVRIGPPLRRAPR